MTQQLREDSLLYHQAKLENVPSILRKGLQPADSTSRGGVESDLTALAAERGIEFPIVRQNCVFCYPFLSQAAEFVPSELEAIEEQPLLEHSGIIVVDGEQVQSDLFVGDFQLISDAIDLQYMDEPDHAVTSESYTDALWRYAESLTRLPSFDSLAAISEQFHIPEVVVEGGTAPETIVECVFLRTVQVSSQ